MQPSYAQDLGVGSIEVSQPGRVIENPKLKQNVSTVSMDR